MTATGAIASSSASPCARESGWPPLPAFALACASLACSPDKDESPEEESKSPCLALRVRDREWCLTNRWDGRRITPSNRSPSSELWTGALDLGVWVGWTVHARWSHGSDGLLRIWKDGHQIVEKRGPNSYNDPRGMYFEIGIYKPPWDNRPANSRVDQRIVEHDDIWFGVDP